MIEEGIGDKDADLCHSESHLDPESGWFPKFSRDFLNQRHTIEDSDKFF